MGFNMMKKNKGFFIIEVLIAILVFSIGIVGILKMQVGSIRTNTEAQYRIQASHLAEDLISKISIDKTNINNYVSKTDVDYINWVKQVNALLPGSVNKPPEISINVVDSQNVLKIIIYWKNNTQQDYSKHEIQTAIL